MKTQIEEIRSLPYQVRCAAYLAKSAKLAEYGAILRTKYKEDEEWTEQEVIHWENLCEELDPYWYALSEKEHSLVKPAEAIINCFCRGESPEERSIYELS